MKFGEIPIRIRLLKRESNIDNHLRWLGYILGPEFIKDVRDTIQTKKNIATLVESARDVVEEDIYAFNTTAGTGNIKKSFEGTTFDYGMGGLGIFSNPSIATSKGPFSSGSPNAASYAAFFEKPEFNSFIPPRDEPTNIKRHRPFMAAMASNQHRLSNEIVLAALFRRLRQKMPKLQS